MMQNDCVFCKILNGDFNTQFIIESEDYVSFHDISPKAPVHALVIPREHSDSLNEIENTELLGKLLKGAKETAEKLGIGDGYRVVINTGKKAGQVVFHTHVHVMGGRSMQWPPG